MSMQLSHQFQVPTSVAGTWAHFQDIGGVAECFPGAQVNAADGDSFSGLVKVKLGPIALVYNGSGSFVEKDEASGRMVLAAKGRDKRGNGTAAAKVTLLMTSGAGGGTAVSVDTDLSITGKPAQFGRGVMQDVSDKLLGQFVECLEQKLAVSTTPMDSLQKPLATSSSPLNEPGAPPLSPTAGKIHGVDSIDLGTTVVPVLAKTYWRPALAICLLLGVVVWIATR
jgi:uncharacterized protein